LSRGDRSIAPKAREFACQHQPNLETALGKETSRNKSVTAVVSRPGYDDDTTSGAVARSDRGRDRPARSLHELSPGHPAGNRHAVGLCHLAGGQELNHVAGG
jgi:hypothetical protein